MKVGRRFHAFVANHKSRMSVNLSGALINRFFHKSPGNIRALMPGFRSKGLWGIQVQEESMATQHPSYSFHTKNCKVPHCKKRKG